MNSFLANDDSTASNVTEFSVSELSGAIKRTMEDSFSRVRVRGELGRVSRPSSGHIYLDLKDDRSVLASVIWKGAASKMPIQPEEGLEVIATGRITTFPGQSKYQLVIDTLEPAGEGALMALLEERKRKLAAEGLFDESRKKPLPYLPRVIGVVTSPSGAVIRDIIHRLNDRFPVHVVVWPVRVQGETSAQEVARAIDGFATLDGTEMVPRPDLLIVARGGGSLEDLWGFNEEIVARAVARCPIPLISAVGHETDTTLIDFVSDRRAPTPTGAAEMAVPVRADLLAHVAQTGARLSNASSRLKDNRRERLTALARGLPQPDRILALPRQRFDAAQLRLTRGLSTGLDAYRSKLGRVAGQLSPARLVYQAQAQRSALNRAATALPGGLDRRAQSARRDLNYRSQRLTIDGVARNASAARDQLEALMRRLDNQMDAHLRSAKEREFRSQRLLQTLSYKSVLERGFALVRDEAGNAVRASKGIKTGQMLDIEFAGDDRLTVHAAGRGPAGQGPAGQSPRKKATQTPDKDQGDQGRLL
ncbi:MAG: exodeoxyribonuclease VII large subunit [Ahrensia sp.]